uniref:CRN-like protein n=1 Tax=Ascaris lumbricoides TaxID=6252 RepID=A0A0M3IC50_ASCLU
MFSAQKQVPPRKGCDFMATSVAKKHEVKTVRATIKELRDRIAFAEAADVGLILIPFSAKDVTGREWHGAGAVCGMPCTLTVPLNHQSHMRVEQQAELVEDQLGVVVSHPGPLKHGHAFVYSPQTGLARLPHSSLDSSIRLGSWIKYDACKYISLKMEKCVWEAARIIKVEQPQTVNHDCNESGKLIVETKAIACRIDKPNHAAWLWNDYIGRIYVSGRIFLSQLKAFMVVHLRAQYTGRYEDVPWSAVEMEVIGDNESDIRQCAQRLITDDNWRVIGMEEKPNGKFYGFLEHHQHGSAFFAWTDFSSGCNAPHVGEICRATVFKQFRSKSQCWRAVLVSTILNGKPICKHPLYSYSGQISFPLPVAKSFEKVLNDSALDVIWGIGALMSSYDNNERSHAYHDKETQTEPMLEQIIVNDIFNDKSMLQKFIDVSPRQNQFPSHVESYLRQNRRK